MPSASSNKWSQRVGQGQPTVRALLAAAAQTVQGASSTPRLDVELLLGHVLGWSRARLLAEAECVPAAQQRAAFQHLVTRRAAQEPVAYLIGHREFFGLDLLVDQRVLIPRPETELLVERALAVAHQRSRRPETPVHSPALTIADIGTGSGAIAIALAHHLPHCHIYATDIAPAALEVAHQNVVRCSVEQRVHLLQGDLLDPLPAPVDMIVSNPPYTILTTIDDDVRRYQPHLALDGGDDGLYLYRRLLAQTPRWLKPGGALLLEIGALQAMHVSTLLRDALPTFHITVYRDLAGWDRVVVGVDESEREGGIASWRS